MMYGNERQQTKSITSISARTQSSRHQPDQVVWLPLLESFKQYMSKLLSLSADAITAFTNQTKTTRYSGKHASWLSIIGLTSELQTTNIALSALTFRKERKVTAKAQPVKQQQQHLWNMYDLIVKLESAHNHPYTLKPLLKTSLNITIYCTSIPTNMMTRPVTR